MDHYRTPHETGGPRGPMQWAYLTNMDLALRTMFKAIHAGDGMPRIALFYGYSGYGKSVAAGYTAAQSNAAYILLNSAMSKKVLLEKLANELGVVRRARATISDLLDDVIGSLNEFPRPIIIDEADYAIPQKLLGIIRDIHDQTNAPIMLVGEEQLPVKIGNGEYERFDNRIIAATPAQPASISDGRLLRDVYAQGVKISDDLVDYFTERCGGVARRIAVNIKAAHDVAIEELAATEIDRAAWGDRRVADGAIATRKAFGGL